MEQKIKKTKTSLCMLTHPSGRLLVAKARKLPHSPYCGVNQGFKTKVTSINFVTVHWLLFYFLCCSFSAGHWHTFILKRLIPDAKMVLVQSNQICSPGQKSSRFTSGLYDQLNMRSSINDYKYINKCYLIYPYSCVMCYPL